MNEFWFVIGGIEGLVVFGAWALVVRRDRKRK